MRRYRPLHTLGLRAVGTNPGAWVGHPAGRAGAVFRLAKAQLLIYPCLSQDPGLVILDKLLASTRDEHLIEEAIDHLLAGRTAILLPIDGNCARRQNSRAG